MQQELANYQAKEAANVGSVKLSDPEAKALTIIKHANLPDANFAHKSNAVEYFAAEYERLTGISLEDQTRAFYTALNPNQKQKTPTESKDDMVKRLATKIFSK